MTYIPKTVPYVHQETARDRARGRAAFAYLMEMGTGKSKVIIDEIGEGFTTGDFDGALILAPKGVYLNWVNREIPAHLPDPIQQMTDVLAWNGGGQNYQRRLAKMLECDGRFKIMVMNTEAFSFGGKAMGFALTFIECQERCYGAVDESTQIKTPDANRTKNVVELGQKLFRRRIASGLPTPRSPLDLYSQFEFLGYKMLGYSSFYSFRAHYAVMRRKEFHIPGSEKKRKVWLVVNYQNVDNLNKRLEPHAYRVMKDDCLDLPPKVYETRDVEMTDEQRRVYDEVKENATAALDEARGGGHVTATEIIVQLLRLQQILCGHVKDEEGQLRELPSNRDAVLLETIEEIQGKVIIWSRFRYNVDRIVAALKKEYGSESVVEYHGGTNQKDRETANRRFQEDPTCRFIVSNSQTGGFGNTWTAASYEIYYSNDFDLEKRLQSEDRAHRVGQTKSVTIIDLMCRGTMDEKTVLALRKKIDIATAVMGDGYREWLI